MFTIKEDFLMKKYIAECIGTFTLVLLGCGTAMLVGCDAAKGSGYLLTALAFGLTIVAMAYCIGNISGCHVNPAVSLAVLLTGGMEKKDFWGYVSAQCIGSIMAAAVLKVVFTIGNVTDKTGGFGANGLAGVNGSAVAGLVVEIILTFIFIFVILEVTDSKTGNSSLAGLVIGLTLVLVHIFGIGLTGTSVNPARSLGPALLADASAILSLWVFIIGPCAGSVLAAYAHKYFKSEKNK